MKKKTVQLSILILMVSMLLTGCKKAVNKTNTKDKSEKEIRLTEFNINYVDSLFAQSIEQYNLLLDHAKKADSIPRTSNDDGGMRWVNDHFDWTDGFFPGSLWYLYEYTNDEKWKDGADYFQRKFEGWKSSKDYHDLGFIFNSSYGNGYRLTNSSEYKKVLIEAAESLSSRYNPVVRSILSWDVDKGWQSERGWKFPVIIDNMLNLELLFEASELSGEDKYREIAVEHAKTTMNNHFREDYSSFHVVDYDPETGSVRSKQTAQGFADSSSWARGQAWGVYGFTMVYRYTNDKKFLSQAEKIANFIMDYKGMPEDLIPYWDYDAPKIPNEPRDASAAAITASALLELANYSKENKTRYNDYAIKILKSLSSRNYRASIGDNNNFILKHSVGSIPHNNEIDVPLNYADYYYLESLLRYKESLK